jgi:hypothetical protein
MGSVSERSGPDINWVQALAGALAAVSSAVLLSTVGVAGTIIGAAAGSVIATVGSAVYSHYLELSKQRVAAAQALAFERAFRARAHAHNAAGTAAARAAHQEVREADEQLERADRDLRSMSEGAGEGASDDAKDDAGNDPSDGGASTRDGTDVVDSKTTPRLQPATAGDPESGEGVRWQAALHGLPWKRIALITAAVFVAAMAAILAFELFTGRAVSTFTGGSDKQTRTSFSGVGNRQSDKDDVPGEQPGEQPSEGRTTSGSSPTADPTTEETADPDDPTGAPTEEQTDDETAEPSSSPTTPTPTTGAPSPTSALPTPTAEPVEPTTVVSPRSTVAP